MRSYPRFAVEFVTPNCQPGAVTVYCGPLVVCLGWAAPVRGFDVVWGDRFIISW